jgi:5-oxoprolinase (ATP-hydrolysing) subunit A
MRGFPRGPPARHERSEWRARREGCASERPTRAGTGPASERASGNLGAVAGSIDFNSDLGEGAGTDMALMPLITSANIACGGHAGNENTMRTTIELAIKNKVAIGAHPGYPDRERFGRVPMDIPARELIESIRRQVDSLIGVASRMGARVTHVKAHGALYNQGERDATTARNIIFGVQAATGGNALVIIGPPGSAMLREASGMGMKVAREGFVDRAYEPDGTLQSRSVAGSVLTNPADAVRQALSFVKDGGVTAVDGTFLKLAVDTLCLHGDTAGAPEIAGAVRAALAKAKVKVAPFRS